MTRSKLGKTVRQWAALDVGPATSRFGFSSGAKVNLPSADLFCESAGRDVRVDCGTAWNAAYLAGHSFKKRSLRVNELLGTDTAVRVQTECLPAPTLVPKRCLGDGQSRLLHGVDGRLVSDHGATH